MGKAAKGSSGRDWTVADIPSQAGRRALVTGANSGIGFYAALELARTGAHVLMACRDAAKGEQAVTRLLAEVPEASVELVSLDLASLASVHACAEAELTYGLPLDLLINNAGVMTPPHRMETADGFELQFGTNVLGHFALTALLMPALERAAAAATARPRVVTLASVAHKTGKLHFDDLQYEIGYNPFTSYQQSKLADLMFAFELDRRLRVSDSRVMSLAAHPGVANTNLFKAHQYPAFEHAARRVVGVAIGLLLNSEADGALPTLFAATAPDAVDGGYYGPQGFAEWRGGNVGPAKVARQALNHASAARLWTECEQLTGTRFVLGM